MRETDELCRLPKRVGVFVNGFVPLGLGLAVGVGLGFVAPKNEPQGVENATCVFFILVVYEHRTTLICNVILLGVGFAENADQADLWRHL